MQLYLELLIGTVLSARHQSILYSCVRETDLNYDYQLSVACILCDVLIFLSQWPKWRACVYVK